MNLPRLTTAGCSLLLLALGGCTAGTPPIDGPDGRPRPGSIAELVAVPIGGMDQWVRIRGRDRIFLLGHSWGTQLGIRLVQEHPDDYHAYVGVAQVVDQNRSQILARDWLEERLQAEGRSRDLRRLEALGPAPYTDHGDYVRFARMIDSQGGNMDVGFARLAWISIRAPEYTLGDLRAWLRGSNRGSGPMWDAPDYQGFNAFQQIPRLEVPVHFFMGRRDRNTPLELLEEYVEVLQAPVGKEIVVFEESAHTPFLGEPERFSQELLRVKREVLGL